MVPVLLYFIGVDSNSWTPPWLGHKQDITPVTGTTSPFPCVFQTIKSQEPSIETAMFYDWSWFQYLGNTSIPNTLDKEVNCGDGYPSCDVSIAKDSSEYLKEVLSNKTSKSYTFIYFGNVDEVGHGYGWCGTEYEKEVNVVDGLVGQVLDVIDALNMTSEVLVYLSADHGGDVGTTHHGSQDDACLMIPMFIRGPGVKKNHSFKIEVRNEDIAPTGVYALGLQPSPWWKGKPMMEAFDNP